ncbi:hypothetical protein F503_04710 [Ophiostoma piceae UAMH 11346]|uniref:Uncharacterized protein n=1 Tax=Ophiostoma piceae (strain UAMH 11346) TaxID=1262450 RepID=S3CU47_OPHP1|nr:hypothetical protein F503_04710 [Ophiostoma piceae UAMH 11346]
MPPRSAAPRIVDQAVSNRNHAKIREDISGQYLQNWDEVFTMILGHFNDLGIKITEVMYMGNVVIIILQDDSADMGRVPYIALMKLNASESFENKLFISEDFPEGKRLQQLRPAQQLPQYEILYMESPGTNAIVGTHFYTSRCRIPSDDASAGPHDWLRGSWMYFVQDENRSLLDSICGSAICDGNGNVESIIITYRI